MKVTLTRHMVSYSLDIDGHYYSLSPERFHETLRLMGFDMKTRDEDGRIKAVLGCYEWRASVEPDAVQKIIEQRFV